LTEFRDKHSLPQQKLASQSAPEILHNLQKSETLFGPTPQFKKKSSTFSTQNPFKPRKSFITQQSLDTTLLQYGQRYKLTSSSGDAEFNDAAAGRLEASEILKSVEGDSQSLLPSIQDGQSRLEQKLEAAARAADTVTESQVSEEVAQVQSIMTQILGEQVDSDAINVDLLTGLLNSESSSAEAQQLRAAASKYLATLKSLGNAENIEQQQQQEEARHQHSVNRLTEKKSQIEASLKAIQTVYDQKVAQFHDLKTKNHNLKQLKASLIEKQKKLASIATPENRQKIALLKQQMQLLDSIEEQTVQFQSTIKTQKAYLESKLSQTHDPYAKKLASLKDEYLNIKQAHDQLKAKNAQLAREFVMYERRLNDVPGRGDLLQYQMRLLELAKEINDRLRETRKFYDKYNMLTELKRIYSQEIQLTEQISQGFVNMKNGTDARSGYLKQLAKICFQSDSILKKYLDKQDRLASERDSLYQKNALLRKTQNDYYLAVQHLNSIGHIYEQLSEIAEKHGIDSLQ